MTDLFGYEIKENPKKIGSLKSIWNYRLADKNISCKTCNHIYYVNGNTARYYKCKLISFTNGAASDVKLKYICNRWKK